MLPALSIVAWRRSSSFGQPSFPFASSLSTFDTFSSSCFASGLSRPKPAIIACMPASRTESCDQVERERLHLVGGRLERDERRAARRERRVRARVERDRDVRRPRAGNGHGERADHPAAHVRRPRWDAPVGDRAGAEPVVGRRVRGGRAARQEDRDRAVIARPEKDVRPAGPGGVDVERDGSRTERRSSRARCCRRRVPAHGLRSAPRPAPTGRSSAARARRRGSGARRSAPSASSGGLTGGV